MVYDRLAACGAAAGSSNDPPVRIPKQVRDGAPRSMAAMDEWRIARIRGVTLFLQNKMD